MPRPGDLPARRTRRDRLVRIVPLLLLALPAGADWLITLEGRMIETAGPWTIDGETLTYTDLEGEERTLEVDEVDLEGSEETTALRGGEPRVVDEEEAPSAAADGKQRPTRKRQRDKPKIILYMTSLCQECTRVRELLESLGVDFVAKDINISRTALKEYKKKAGHGGGLPVVDVDGALVFSGNPRVIRQRVEEMRRQEAESEHPEPSPPAEGAPGG